MFIPSTDLLLFGIQRQTHFSANFRIIHTGLLVLFLHVFSENKRIQNPFVLAIPVFQTQTDFHCSSNLYIFGHSLDITDGDILRALICNDNVNTKIFYYREKKDDKRTLEKLISNLVRVIGQDELIKRTGGEFKTIEFIPQSVQDNNEAK